ncbi:MAG: hypothetical protein UNLARM2_0640 [Candidatus Micrarchaeum acidiphilum ARMAN-2]|jgi:DNA-directed RNA polymerase, subunit L|uniref:DNA-directed RNA polymerase subunit Rpo11 n=1 Tax=Candidatus Micrarchaeum acidiphilum ARMAN-2 TaxID=425595 RepID=C7DHU9_MICA2|nr:MAG: hypothetical protein UNLARM2_0640 [Candidatus Micrarchaeum acidiphilum ARMAN-2]
MMRVIAMEAKIIKNDSKELQIEFEDGDITIPDLIVNAVINDKDVEFAGVEKDHPEVGKPRLVIKTLKKHPAKIVEEAIESIEKDTETIKKMISKK